MTTFWRRLSGAGRRLAGLNQTQIRYLIVGGLNTVVGLTVFPALYFLLGPLDLHYLAIMSLSQVVCVTFSFVTQKLIVFRTRGGYLREYGKFLVFHFLNYLANLFVLPLLVEMAGMSPIWAQTGFTVFVILTSYFWHSRITFSRKASC